MTVFVFHFVKIISSFKVGLEQVFEILRRNANTFVCDFNVYGNEGSRSSFTLIRSYFNLNCFIWIGKLDSVRQQIDDNLLKA
jgi:hypothetical protein